MTYIPRDRFNTVTDSLNPVIAAIAKLELGDGLIVEDSEWTPKTDLGRYVYQYDRRGRSNALVGKSYSIKKTPTGWRIIRIEGNRKR